MVRVSPQCRNRSLLQLCDENRCTILKSPPFSFGYLCVSIYTNISGEPCPDLRLLMHILIFTIIINRLSSLDKTLRHYCRITASSTLSSCRQILESDPIPHPYVTRRTKPVPPVPRSNPHRLLLHARSHVLELLYSIFPSSKQNPRPRCNSRRPRHNYAAHFGHYRPN